MKKKLCFSLNIWRDLPSKSLAVLFYSRLQSHKENEMGKGSSGRSSSRHISFTSVLSECKAQMKNINANICSFWFC